ncbi:MAG: DUF308 domain-containing protein [Oscillospiraceae bacterium]|nr:DUF308 domain-containing protein [Oscillospiraceae bacterium]
MNHLKENAGNLVMSVCEAVIGVLLLVNPVGFTSFVLIALGAVLAIRGVVNVISYFRAKPEDALRSQSLTAGLLLLAIGLFCMLRFRWLIALFPALTVFYGVVILLAGFSKIQWTVDCIRLKRRWIVVAISAALSLISAVVILANPFSAAAALWTFAAISLIVEAVFDVVAVFLSGRIK